MNLFLSDLPCLPDSEEAEVLLVAWNKVQDCISILLSTTIEKQMISFHLNLQAIISISKLLDASWRTSYDDYFSVQQSPQFYILRLFESDGSMYPSSPGAFMNAKKMQDTIL